LSTQSTLDLAHLDELASLSLGEGTSSGLAGDSGENSTEGDSRGEGSASHGSSTLAELTEDDSNAELANGALELEHSGVGLNLLDLVSLECVHGSARNGVGEKELIAVGLLVRPRLNVVEDGLTIISSAGVTHADNIAGENIDVDDATKAISPFLSEGAVEVLDSGEGETGPIESSGGSDIAVELLGDAIGVLIDDNNDGLDFTEIPKGDTVDSRGGIRGIPRLKANISRDVVVEGAASSIADGASVVRDDNFPCVRTLEGRNGRINRARERDEAKIADWRAHDWPRLKKELAAKS